MLLLVKKDLETKKNALNEEKNLINERLQARKNAADDAAKYEELENLKSQLSMIQMDSTRTKEALELRKKISDLESELSWKSAQEQADHMSEGLDQQMQAYDDYMAAGDDNMEKLLSDNNNFVDEVNNILAGTSEEVMAWLANNVKEYATLTEDAQKQMTQGWLDTWKQMKGITDTYWEQIYSIIDGGRDFYIDYMKQSDEYLNASESQRMSLEYTWGTQYDDYIASLRTGAYWDHEDDWYSYGTAETTASDYAKTTADNTSKILEKINYVADKGITLVTADNHVPLGANGTNVSFKDQIKLVAYATGGLNTHPGLAWLDGTTDSPEYVLNSEDFKLVRDSIAAAKTLFIPDITRIDASRFGSTQSIGDVSVVINEATISSDQDIEDLAYRVGEKFTEAIEKNGVITNKYSW